MLQRANGCGIFNLFTMTYIWDREPPAPPNLFIVVHDGTQVDAVAQTTKQGYVFVFDRVSTYAIGGNQYIVIACGGGKLNTKSSDKYVAFRLKTP